MTQSRVEGRTKVLIADDHVLFREAIRKLIELEEDLEVVGEAGDGPQTLKLVQELKPDVVLMDIALPGVNGIRTVKQIRKNNRKVRIVMVTMYDDISHIMESFQAGASGYLTKTSPSSQLLEAIRLVQREGVCIPPPIEQKLIKGISEKNSAKKRAGEAPLTNREIKILQLIAAGGSNSDIARKLSICEKTVKNHLNHIYGKLRVKNRVQAVMEALRREYIRRE